MLYTGRADEVMHNSSRRSCLKGPVVIRSRSLAYLTTDANKAR